MTTDLNARAFVKRAQSKGPCLVPRDIMADEWLATVKLDAELLLRIDKPRNPKHHRLLMAILKFVMDNTEGRYRLMDDLLDDLKIATGLTIRKVNVLTGVEYLMPKSIAFSAMKQDEFAIWFDAVVDLLLQNVIPLRKVELLDEIYKMACEPRPALTHGKKLTKVSRYEDDYDDDHQDDDERGSAGLRAGAGAGE